MASVFGESPVPAGYLRSLGGEVELDVDEAGQGTARDLVPHRGEHFVEAPVRVHKLEQVHAFAGYLALHARSRSRC